MIDEEPLVRESFRTPRAVAVAGLVFVVLFDHK
jgi:hypothetical protein